MPGMDKTGPFGTGPIGRGMGLCDGRQACQGRGRGLRRGGGMAWGKVPTIPSSDEEKDILEQQKGWLETQLAAISQRLQEFGKTKVS